MYNLKITYKSDVTRITLTEEEKLHSMIDCISYIEQLKNIDYIKILKVNIDYIEED